MLSSAGFGSLLLIVSEFCLFCAHELCVSCPRVFREEDKSKAELHTSSNPTLANSTREWGTLYMEVACKRPKRERRGHSPPTSCVIEGKHNKGGAPGEQRARTSPLLLGCGMQKT